MTSAFPASDDVGFRMTVHTFAPSLVQEIEDAILLGNVAELDAILAQIDEDDASPELRSGLEALRHFRFHYGKNGMAPPKDEIEKKKAALMEAAWGSELLDMIRRNAPPIAKQA